MITNISSFEMKIKIKTHEIRDEKKKYNLQEDSNHKKEDETIKNQAQSNPLIAYPLKPDDISSPALSERNFSDPISNKSEATKDTSENEKKNKFRISIEPESPDQHEKDKEKEKQKQKTLTCECGHVKKIVDFPNDDVAHHVKFDSFDLIRLIGKGSFGQVFLVINNFNILVHFFHVTS